MIKKRVTKKSYYFFNFKKIFVYFYSKIHNTIMIRYHYRIHVNTNTDKLTIKNVDLKTNQMMMMGSKLMRSLTPYETMAPIVG